MFLIVGNALAGGASKSKSYFTNFVYVFFYVLAANYSIALSTHATSNYKLDTIARIILRGLYY
jgi:hypothetical protein